MFKSTANAQQMLTRTANHSTKGSAKGFVDGIGENAALVLRDSERKQSLRQGLLRKIELLSVELGRQKINANETLRRNDMHAHMAANVRVKEIKAELTALRHQTAELKPDKQVIPQSLIENAFVDICKETMTKAHFDLTLRKAKERVRLANTNGEADHGKS
jgi:hypothetical protein